MSNQLRTSRALGNWLEIGQTKQEPRVYWGGVSYSSKLKLRCLTPASRINDKDSGTSQIKSRVGRVIIGAASAERYLIVLWDSGPLATETGGTTCTHALYPLSLSCLLPRGQSSESAASQGAGATNCHPEKQLSEKGTLNAHYTHPRSRSGMSMFLHRPPLLSNDVNPRISYARAGARGQVVVTPGMLGRSMGQYIVVTQQTRYQP
ncbi:hypothetical protein EDB92DRAFT_2105439 [Lactarius akahatsu]|uniref:Uncharacterized protein n=1 Tax=Lactarius akahatsu TaxID=416441 RepID=A0AAD4QB13_9AGAM|nr:hypothetical protein EDB92DRAFT_2105439 [Lactarius akahatsu]